jgi:endonuclease YncB( thermonuclease family)
MMLACLGILSACSDAGPLDGLEAGERGRVVRVVDGDTLVLDTGQSVRLVGIEAPSGPYGDREAQPHFQESKRMLEDMALGRDVQLHYGGLTRDRYDRALAHARTADALGPDYWLNAEMVIRGGARVRVYPDTAAANAPLLALEETARQQGTGLWRTPHYVVPSARGLPEPFGGFQLVQGKVSGMQGSDGFGAVCDLSLEESPLRLQVQTAAAPLCQQAPGRNVLARGYVRETAMEITHPLNLEILPSTDD